MLQGPVGGPDRCTPRGRSSHSCPMPRGGPVSRSTGLSAVPAGVGLNRAGARCPADAAVATRVPRSAQRRARGHLTSPTRGLAVRCDASQQEAATPSGRPSQHTRTPNSSPARRTELGHGPPGLTRALVVGIARRLTSLKSSRSLKHTPLRVPLAAPRTHRDDSDDGTGAVPDRGSEPLPRPREPGCLSAGGRTVPFRRQVSLTETGIPRRGATDRWGAATHARAGAGRTITANMLVAAWTIRKAQGSGRFVHRL
jgi:hypothetical protein